MDVFKFQISFLFLLLVSCSNDIDTHLAPLDQNFLCHQAIPNRDLSYGLLPVSQTQNKVFFNGKIGFTVGDLGTILKSDDGGLSWDIRLQFDQRDIGNSSMTKADLFAIHFPSEDVGYAGGNGEYDGASKQESGAVFLKTTDGGDTWDKSTLTNVKSIADLLFFTKDQGISLFEVNNPISPPRLNIYSTENGGQNWTAATLSIKSIINQKVTLLDGKLYFLAKNYKDESVIVQSNDLGKTWYTFATPERSCSKLHHFTTGDSYLICQDKVYQSEEGFASWSDTGFDINPESFAYFFTREEGFISDPIYEWTTTNGQTHQELIGFELRSTKNEGMTWSSTVLSPKCQINGKDYLDDQGGLHLLNNNQEIAWIR